MKRVRKKLWIGVLNSSGDTSVVLYDRAWQPRSSSQVRLYRLKTDMLLILDKSSVRPRLRPLRPEEREVESLTIQRYYACRKRQGLDPASLRQKREQREREQMIWEMTCDDEGPNSEEGWLNSSEAQEVAYEQRQERELAYAHCDDLSATDGLDPIDPTEKFG